MNTNWTELKTDDLRMIDGGIFPIALIALWAVAAGGPAAISYINYKSK